MRSVIDVGTVVSKNQFKGSRGKYRRSSLHVKIFARTQVRRTFVCCAWYTESAGQCLLDSNHVTNCRSYWQSGSKKACCCSDIFYIGNSLTWRTSRSTGPERGRSDGMVCSLSTDLILTTSPLRWGLKKRCTHCGKARRWGTVVKNGIQTWHKVIVRGQSSIVEQYWRWHSTSPNLSSTTLLRILHDLSGSTKNRRTDRTGPCFVQRRQTRV